MFFRGRHCLARTGTNKILDAHIIIFNIILEILLTLIANADYIFNLNYHTVKHNNAKVKFGIFQKDNIMRLLTM